MKQLIVELIFEGISFKMKFLYTNTQLLSRVLIVLVEEFGKLTTRESHLKKSAHVGPFSIADLGTDDSVP